MKKTSLVSSLTLFHAGVNVVEMISAGTLGCDEGSIQPEPRESPQTHIGQRQMAAREK